MTEYEDGHGGIISETESEAIRKMGFACGEILKELGQERLRQISLGYTPEHDDAHNVVELVTFAQPYLGAVLFSSTSDPHYIRENLVKAAAMLVATIEFVDRNEG